ncbi:MAG: peptidylprolyl isomerase [Planctomycetota bacterium]|nr:MAG: peptidylprolyl isomerase [Planctomycetota bacterium]
MLKIRQNSRVELDYTIAGTDGEIYESSAENGPLTYVQGEDEIPPLLQAALEGRAVGEEVELVLAPADAFGEYDPDGIVSIPPAEFPEDTEVEPGDLVPVTIELDDEGGECEEIEMRVVEVTPDAVILDMNPALAGKTITFTVRVLSVRNSDAE